MKRVVTMALLLAVSGLAYARGSSGDTPVNVPCTVGTNHKCAYPEATPKDMHIYQKLQRFLRKRGK